jgi:TonB-linked SusC/RagA family outer membrane protein
MSNDTVWAFLTKATRNLKAPKAPIGVLLGFALVAFAMPRDVNAQAATVSGTVTDADGQPVRGAQVVVQALALSTFSGEDGSYRLVVPEARLAQAMTITITARLIGYRSSSMNVTVAPGGSISQNFSLEADPFQLEAVVVTGQGMRQERAKLGTVINSVSAEELTRDHAQENVVAALAGKAPNVEVTSSTGDPGGGAYIRIRGSKSIAGGTEPLVVIDGVAVTNESNTIEESIWGTPYQNRLADISTDDIESIEILKGAAAAGIYGSRAANGVVLITTKTGARNQTQVTVRSSTSFEEATQLPDLQRQFGQGLVNLVDGVTNDSPNNLRSWGPELPAGTPTFDHAGEMFGTSVRTDNFASLSGGTDRTTYYLSLGYVYHNGIIKGNSAYERATGRLKGSHDIFANLNVAGNFAFTTSGADLIQQGSNLSGLLLGGFRQPPEFNACRAEFDPCWRNEEGFHFNYTTPNPTGILDAGIFDNPFFVANEVVNTSSVNRYMGNLQVDWDPFSWLALRYLGGADFANDDRLTVFPKSNASLPEGQLFRGALTDKVFDQTILAAVEGRLNPNIAASITVGQNLNQTEFRRFQVDAQNLILGTDQLDFTVDKTPNEFTSTVRTEGYFFETTVDLWDQLFLRVGARYDGSNTFGGDIDSLGNREASRFWYPKGSLAWDFTRYVPFFDFVKVRASYGESGKQPPIFTNVSAFETDRLNDGWTSPNGLLTVYNGFDGVVFENTEGNTAIQPERTKEIEGGFDFAFLDNSLSLGFTTYWSKTTDAILQLTIPASTGFQFRWSNGAEWRNWGFETELDWNVVQGENFSWRLNGHWAKNNSMVDELLDLEQFGLDGFSSSASSVVPGYAFGVHYGGDWYRFGRGSRVGGVDIDNTYSGWQPGDLYICGAGDPGCSTPGLPLEDDRERVIGDPNPDWTGSIRSTFTFLNNKLRVSGLLDIKRGGDMWNGTKGALFSYGTHAGTLPVHGLGVDSVFATCADCGPGAGSSVRLDWASWGRSGPGNGFTGPAIQFIEDAGFVKVRDISVSYTLDQPWLSKIGFNEADITFSGRNLVTWTDYTGMDPESNLTGQSTGRGLEYFNHPQVRTFVFTLSLRR